MQLTPETAMMMRGMLLSGADREQGTTAKVISAIPNQNRDYKPDPKSKTAMDLASHIAQADVMFLDGIAAGAFEPASRQKAPVGATTPELIAWYNTTYKESSAKVANLDPHALMKVIDFHGIVQMPAVMYLTFLNNHMIHHRGQLSTYLRAMGGKCPSIYGPSADEEMMAAGAP